MTAANSIGHEFQTFDRHFGWRRASPVFKTEAEARTALQVAVDEGKARAQSCGITDPVERRYYEALDGYP